MAAESGKLRGKKAANHHIDRARPVSIEAPCACFDRMAVPERK